MRRFRAIVQSSKEPEDKLVLWITYDSLSYYNNGSWIPLLETPEIGEMVEKINKRVDENLKNESDSIRRDLHKLIELEVEFKSSLVNTYIMLGEGEYVSPKDYNSVSHPPVKIPTYLCDAQGQLYKAVSIESRENTIFASGVRIAFKTEEELQLQTISASYAFEEDEDSNYYITKVLEETVENEALLLPTAEGGLDYYITNAGYANLSDFIDKNSNRYFINQDSTNPNHNQSEIISSIVLRIRTHKPVELLIQYKSIVYSATSFKLVSSTRLDILAVANDYTNTIIRLSGYKFVFELKFNVWGLTNILRDTVDIHSNGSPDSFLAEDGTYKKVDNPAYFLITETSDNSELFEHYVQDRGYYIAELLKEDLKYPVRLAHMNGSLEIKGLYFRTEGELVYPTMVSILTTGYHIDGAFNLPDEYISTANITDLAVTQNKLSSLVVGKLSDIQRNTKRILDIENNLSTGFTCIFEESVVYELNNLGRVLLNNLLLEGGYPLLRRLLTLWDEDNFNGVRALILLTIFIFETGQGSYNLGKVIHISSDSDFLKLYTKGYEIWIDDEGAILQKSDDELEPFIALWNAACNLEGSYNRNTKMFTLNGITDLTYEEALAIYTKGAPTRGNADYFYVESNIRTHLPMNIYNSEGALEMFTRSRIVLINMPLIRPGVNFARECTLLERANVYSYTDNTLGEENSSTWRDCTSLNYLRASFWYSDRLSLVDSPNLGRDTFLWMSVATRDGVTGEIKVAVHPDVFAKLTGDTSNPVVLLMSDAEKDAWQKAYNDCANASITIVLPDGFS